MEENYIKLAERKYMGKTVTLRLNGWFVFYFRSFINFRGCWEM